MCIVITKHTRDMPMKNKVATSDQFCVGDRICDGNGDNTSYCVIQAEPGVSGEIKVRNTKTGTVFRTTGQFLSGLILLGYELVSSECPHKGECCEST